MDVSDFISSGLLVECSPEQCVKVAEACVKEGFRLSEYCKDVVENARKQKDPSVIYYLFHQRPNAIFGYYNYKCCPSKEMQPFDKFDWGDKTNTTFDEQLFQTLIGG